MFGTDDRPHREKLVAGFGERPATADAHETRVANSGEDYTAILRRQYVATTNQSGVCATSGSGTLYGLKTAKAHIDQLWVGASKTGSHGVQY